MASKLIVLLAALVASVNCGYVAAPYNAGYAGYGGYPGYGGYAAPGVVAKAVGSPLLGGAYAAPYAPPVVAKAGFGAPAYSYSSVAAHPGAAYAAAPYAAAPYPTAPVVARAYAPQAVVPGYAGYAGYAGAPYAAAPAAPGLAAYSSPLVRSGVPYAHSPVPYSGLGGHYGW